VVATASGRGRPARNEHNFNHRDGGSGLRLWSDWAEHNFNHRDGGCSSTQKHVPERHAWPVMHEAPHVVWLTPQVVPPSRFGLPMPAQTPPRPSST